MSPYDKTKLSAAGKIGGSKGTGDKKRRGDSSYYAALAGKRHHFGGGRPKTLRNTKDASIYTKECAPCPSWMPTKAKETK